MDGINTEIGESKQCDIILTFLACVKVLAHSCLKVGEAESDFEPLDVCSNIFHLLLIRIRTGFRP